jgi:hypothetical protein
MVPTPTATATEVVAVCVGDCDGSREVTIDELLTLVSISLGDIPISACAAADRNFDGAVSIDEILTAVYAALNSCAANLIPVRAEALPCPGGCGPQLVEVCVRNDGPLSSPAFDVAINDIRVSNFSALASAAEHCQSVPYVFAADTQAEAVVTVDSVQAIPEIQETDNQLHFPAPNPTACDRVCASAHGG